MSDAVIETLSVRLSERDASVLRIAYDAFAGVVRGTEDAAFVALAALARWRAGADGDRSFTEQLKDDLSPAAWDVWYPVEAIYRIARIEPALRDAGLLEDWR